MKFNMKGNSALNLVLVVLVANLANIITASANAYAIIKKANQDK